MENLQIRTKQSSSPEDTMRIGEQIGKSLKGGEIIVLAGDIGSGKTTFVKGLAKGLNSQDQVHSPSFTIANQYKADKLTIYHFDFHRLDDPGIMKAEIAEVINDQLNVVVIEWSEIIKDILPENYLIIEIRPISENIRELEFQYTKDMAILIPNNT
jgi:tRNA threonylcarbamoyladenosine biosynthesis protein TsaE